MNVLRLCRYLPFSYLHKQQTASVCYARASACDKSQFITTSASGRVDWTGKRLGGEQLRAQHKLPSSTREALVASHGALGHFQPMIIAHTVASRESIRRGTKGCAPEAAHVAAAADVGDGPHKAAVQQRQAVGAEGRVDGCAVRAVPAGNEKSTYKKGVILVRSTRRTRRTCKQLWVRCLWML